MALGRRASISATGIAAGHDLGVHLALADPARDQLRVLGAEVDDQDGVRRLRRVTTGPLG